MTTLDQLMNGPREQDPDATQEMAALEMGRCPYCNEPIDHCQGHGEIGDPQGNFVLLLHDNYDIHDRCHPNAECQPRKRVMRTYLVKVCQVWEYPEPVDLPHYDGESDFGDLDQHICDNGTLLQEWTEVVDDDELDHAPVPPITAEVLPAVDVGAHRADVPPQ